MTKKILIAILFVSAIAVSFGGGVYVGWDMIPASDKVYGLANKETGKPGDVDFDIFWEAWRFLENSYVDKDDLKKEAMIHGAISGLFQSLNDPYTIFLDPKEAKKFKDDVSGSFGGIGVEIGMRKGILTVISPLKDTPAEKAGLRAGDKILKIGDIITLDITIDEAVNLIRGANDTEVVLSIVRDGLQNAKEIKIKREIIKIPIVNYEMKDGKVAYIELYHFTSNSSLELRKALQKSLNDGAQKMILDLRNNPGGYLDVAIDISSLFLETGKTIVIEDYGNQKDQKTHKSYGPGSLANFPIVILVNEGTASASEILAGALRDNRQIKLIGAKTFGKGSVQQLKDMGDGSSLKVTIAKWLTPSGHSISEEGLSPDIEVKITEEEFEAEKDPQLDKALEIIKNQ